MKVNVSSILIDHFKTLKDNSTKRISKIDVFIFYILPLIGILIIVLWKPIGVETAKTLIVISSIVAPLLFNALVLVITINHEKITNSDPGLLMKELCVNLSYLILIILLSMPILIAIAHLNINNENLKYALSCITAYLILHIFLKLLMIIKRTYAIINYKVKHH